MSTGAESVAATGWRPADIVDLGGDPRFTTPD